MKSRTSYLLNILTTAVIILVVISTTIFWLRFTCVSYRRTLLPPRSVRLELSPSGLVDDLELMPIPEDAVVVSKTSSNLYQLKDGSIVRKYRSNMVQNPDIVTVSKITFGVYDIYTGSLGLVEAFEQMEYHDSFDLSVSKDIYFLRQESELVQNSDTGKWKRIPKGIWHVVYFDSKLGLIVNADIVREQAPNKSKWTKVIHSYAGPEGISQNPDENIGRFTNLLRHSGPWRRVVFDKAFRQFFNIDFKNQKVTKGPQLDFLPIQFGSVEKNTSKSYISFEPPYRAATEKELADKDYQNGVFKRSKKNSQDIVSLPVRGDMRLSYYPNTVVVLIQDNNLCMLDTDTLKFSHPISMLPSLASPNNLFAYSAVPFFMGDQCENLVVGAVGPDLSPLIGLVEAPSKHKDIETRQLWRFIGGWPALTVSKYILESFQPAIFNIAAFVFAPNFDVAEDPRSLFIQPDSVIGMIGRSYDIEGLERFFLAVAAIAPALIISILLAGWVARDAKRVGLSKTAVSWWTIGTIGFGLTALVAYILTKSKQTMVTCQNCGLLRRTDMDLCHQCHAKWNIPELAPPPWRVLDQSAQPNEPIPDIPPQPNSSISTEVEPPDSD